MLLVCLGIVMAVSTAHLWQKDILFHTDIARDFLVMQDIVETKKPTLIGPRSGGISGVFHGPLWYYLNLLPFIVTGGSPVAMGWWWWLVGVGTVVAFYYMSRQLIKDKTLSLATSLLFASLIFISIPGLYNPSGIIFLSPFIFYFLLSYLKTPKFLSGVLLWLLLGVCVQFQMAFALPLAILVGPLFGYISLRSRRYQDLLTFGFFLLPLATFVLFDLRHDWLQTRSVWTYLQHPTGEAISLKDLAFRRLPLVAFSGISVLGLPMYTSLILVSAALYLGYRDKQTRNAVKIFLYLYLGWWLLTLFFKGTMENYYFMGFLPMVVVMVGLVSSRHKTLAGVFIVAAVVTAGLRLQSSRYTVDRFNTSSWKLLSSIVDDAATHNNFGYFVYSQDQYAYPLKYAFAYRLRKQENVTSLAFQKQPLTILVKAADDPHNPFLTSDYWTREKVRITSTPQEIKHYLGGYTLEVYRLSTEEVAIESDQNMITDLHFR